MNGVLMAALVVGIIGIIIGVVLCIASEVFKVEVNEKEIQVRNLLPGNNCGGCGYPGCDGLAKAIAEGKAPVNACPVGGPDVAQGIAAVLGVEAGEMTRMAAIVRCAGTCDKTKINYAYFGTADCQQASVLPGSGDKSCSYGCLGLGSCVRACEYDAIHIVDGIAQIDRDKCKACGKCVSACPRNIIDLVPYDAKYVVRCVSHDNGKTVRENCDSGCIGCSLCAKTCPSGAIYFENFLARIDQTKCTGCGLCAQKCPKKIIHKLND
ncbi:MAG: RnfABCDGE type electron transport complex subunit B [Lachnospiraceae bacterium]